MFCTFISWLEIDSKANHHGTASLSILAANIEGEAVGAAFGARYLLARTEVIYNDYFISFHFFLLNIYVCCRISLSRIELKKIISSLVLRLLRFYIVLLDHPLYMHCMHLGIEWAERRGARIASVSLGYKDWYRENIVIKI